MGLHEQMPQHYPKRRQKHLMRLAQGLPVAASQLQSELLFAIQSIGFKMVDLIGLNFTLTTQLGLD